MSLYITNLDDWSAGVQLAFLCPPIPLMLLGLAIDFHIAGTQHFRIMCKSFERSPLLLEEMLSTGTIGIRSRFMIVAGMSGAILWPGLFIRRGQLHPDDSKEFPRYLKRRMQLSIGLMSIGAAWCVLGATLVEL
jgi:hypothetical protein